MSASVGFIGFMLASGSAWVADKFYFSKKRKEGEAKPWWVKYCGDFFFVVLGVFIFHSNLFEPYTIPTPSMVPELKPSDYIVTKKFSYSIKIPGTTKEIYRVADPKLGDVIVFRHPSIPGVDYVKRIVGTPGDEVSYLDKKLSINGKEIQHQRTGSFLNEEKNFESMLFDEQIGDVKHSYLNDEQAPSSIYQPEDFPFRESCSYKPNGVVCKVPQGHYYVIGDNRDNSHDSRYWGFVPFENIEGKAIYVLFNMRKNSEFKKIN